MSDKPDYKNINMGNAANFSFPRLNLRFKLSEEFLQNNKYPHLSERRGIVLYETGDCYAVQFDGTKSRQYYHKSFIEITEDEPNTT